MEAEEWKNSSDISNMLAFVAKIISARQFRLFCCGCLRSDLMQPLLQSKSSHRAIETALQFADGLATKEDLQKVQRPAGSAGFQARIRGNQPARAAAGLAYSVTYSDKYLMSFMRRGSQMPDLQLNGEEYELYAHLLRDIVGNPSQHVALDPAWANETVRAIAQKMYNQENFSEMPILADALEELGCNDPIVLAHCREEAPHIRGCWVVDGLLGTV